VRPRIVGRVTAYTSPWLEVESVDVELPEPRGRETFYTVKTHRYVVILAVTEDGRIPLVRQYRPAVDEYVLELPSGHVDPGESSEQAARRELREETGCEAGELVPLGEFFTEPARMSARPEAFFARDVRQVAPGVDPAEQLTPVTVSRQELQAMLADGRFRQAAHAGVVAMAAARSLIDA
jgi:ADP-ribose pyrophosphatase